MPFLIHPSKNYLFCRAFYFNYYPRTTGLANYFHGLPFGCLCCTHLLFKATQRPEETLNFWSTACLDKNGWANTSTVSNETVFVCDKLVLNIARLWLRWAIQFLAQGWEQGKKECNDGAVISAFHLITGIYNAESRAPLCQILQTFRKRQLLQLSFYTGQWW